MEIKDYIKISKDNRFVERTLDWYDKNKRDFPWRSVKDPYKIMVAEFLLQKTNSTKVLSAYKLLIEKYPNVYHLNESNIKDLIDIIRPLGLLKRANMLKKSSMIIVSKHNGTIPDKLEDLLSLPGIGNYSANAILCFGYDQNVPLLDVNIARIIRRIFNLPLKIRIESDNNLFKISEEIINGNLPFNVKKYHYSLIDISAALCRPKKVNCIYCPFNNFCLFNKN